ncbi:glutathione S-transferase T3-like [Eutrema salsugineum]|uniref:glutathione S-transferase T3-like n=1 Tax=Eutrema salsugineum TaxID=72664 RepID=UPI000CED44EA|nr:glutathione S-transferase T3-like [Eutrema salsugineum]
MSSYPFSHSSHFVELLNNQQESAASYPCMALGSSQPPFFCSQTLHGDASCGEDKEKERTARKQWTPSDDILLISSWLNTSKDPVVSNEQKSATRERTSGQNENDVLKMAHEIYFNDNKKKFILEHAWKELRNDQKWCEQRTSKTGGGSKKRRCEDGAPSPNSFAEPDEPEPVLRPPGVKAAKAKGKKFVLDANAVGHFQDMWSIKEKEFDRKEKEMDRKERLSKMSLLNSLIAKKEPLTEFEEALKQKLTIELLNI